MSSSGTATGTGTGTGTGTATAVIDADGDGHGALDGGGDDCDDTDATVFPGAAETWYDGVDADCAGDDDDDQDADGVPHPADCDDTDAALGAPGPETLDGRDNDCDGAIDDVTITDVDAGVVFGATSGAGIGHHGVLALGGDLDGDTAADLVIMASPPLSNAWLVSGAGLVGLSASVDTAARAKVIGDSRPLQRAVGPLRDPTHDGRADLLVGGSNLSSRRGGAWLFSGDGLVGTVALSDADASFEGAGSADTLRHGAAADLDGDGLDDIATGQVYADTGNELDVGGVSVFVGPFTGALDTTDAADTVLGSHAYDLLGDEMSYADADGDGYADLLVGAPGRDDGAMADAGAIHVLAGNAALRWAARADDASTASILGDHDSMALGEDPMATLGDHDGDGRPDLVLALHHEDVAWLWWDAATVTGSRSVASADVSFQGSGEFGRSIGLDSDLDGDGRDEIVLGAYKDDAAGVDAGAVYLFGGGGWAGVVDTSAASAVIRGAAAGDKLGDGVATGGDVDGDGRNDLVIAGSGVDLGARDGGAVYLVRGW